MEKRHSKLSPITFHPQVTNHCFCVRGLVLLRICCIIGKTFELLNFCLECCVYPRSLEHRALHSPMDQNDSTTLIPQLLLTAQEWALMYKIKICRGLTHLLIGSHGELNTIFYTLGQEENKGEVPMVCLFEIKDLMCESGSKTALNSFTLAPAPCLTSPPPCCWTIWWKW